MAFKTIIQALKLYLHSLQSLFNLLLRFDVAHPPHHPLPPCLPPSSCHFVCTLVYLLLFLCLRVAALPVEAVPKKGPGPTQIYEQQKPSLWSCRKGISRFGAIKAHVASVPSLPIALQGKHNEQS